MSTQWGDRLFELSTMIRSQRAVVITQMTSLEETTAVSARHDAIPITWAAEELQEVMERAEAESWQLTARLQGLQARMSHANEWSSWYQDVLARVAAVWRLVASAPNPGVSVGGPSPAACQRRGGFLERVKLPTFSGSVKDYGEFKAQFRELCQGEPKDAVALLVGLT